MTATAGGDPTVCDEALAALPPVPTRHMLRSAADAAFELSSRSIFVP
jgi:hypothetical protein